MASTYDFTGHTIAVTGAGKGIGRATVISLHLSNAAKIIAITRTQSDLDTLIKETNSDGRIVPVCLDLSNQDFMPILEQLFKEHNVNMLVNNAGTGGLTSFEEMTEDNYDRIMQVNLKSATFVAQVFAKNFKSTSGSIVNVSSQAAFVPLPLHTSYCISKAGMDMLTKMMALELGSKNIRINSVNPTVVMTDLGKSAWSDPVKADTVLRRIPLRRFAEVSDVVQPILFLLSDAACMVNGSCLPVDGGYVNCN